MLDTYRESSRRTLLQMLLLWLAGLATSALLAAWQSRSNAEFVRQRFDAEATRLADQLVKRIQAFEYGLRGARGAVISAGEHRIDRQTFRHYFESRDIDREFPGARGFGFIRRVPAEQEASFVQRARADGPFDFTVHALGPPDGERYVIQFIEPIERNRPAVGLDIASEPNRRQAAADALRTGEATITAPITLVQASGRLQRSFLVLLPVYRPGLPIDTPQQRMAAGFGWSYAPVVIDEVLAGFDLRDDAFTLRLADAAPHEAERGPSEPFFFSSDGSFTPAPGGLSTGFTRAIFGRTWQIELSARPAFHANLHLAPPVRTVLLGALGSTLLTVLVWVYVVGRQRAGRQQHAFTITLEQQVQERTAQLAAVQRENTALLNTVKLHALYSVTDARGTILDVNDNFCRVSGYARSELLGRNHRIINSGTHDAAFWRHFWRTITSGQGWRGEICNRAKDGSLYWVESIIAPFVGDDGRIEKYISIRTDITHRRDAQRRAHAAEAANQAKSGFLAHISHEIRTPLNAILGLGYLLAKTPLDAEQRQLMQRIDVAGQALLTLLSNVLDLSKIEHGEMSIDRHDFDLEALLHDLADLYAPQAQARGVAFEWAFEPGLPARWHGDATRVRQILMNLLSNADKFTARGRIRLQAMRVPADPARVRLSVQDTGEGVAPAVLAGLFTPFAQADASTTRRHGGTGLGLSIVRRFAELLGGTVGATSEPGRGSHFWVDLPLEPAQDPSASEADATAEAPAVEAQLPDMRVMVVDDSEVNLDLTRRLLEREGALVTTCDSAAAALQRLQDSVAPGASAFDIVLMDVQMPGTDGMEATQQLRQIPGLETVPVLALTAGVLVTERQRALAAGMSDFIAKPIEPEALVQTLRRHVQAARGTEGPVRARARRPTPRLPPDWPLIDGIEPGDVAERLGHDVGLLARQLRRLFKEFAPEMAEPPVQPPSDTLPARMHKLRGTAGILGALDVHRAATAVEHALRATPPAPPESIRALQQALASTLRHLHANAQPFLDATPTVPAAPPTDAAATLEDADLSHLKALLARHDLAALELVEQLQAPLQSAMGPDGYQALQDALDELDFAQAVRGLNRRPAPPSR